MILKLLDANAEQIIFATGERPVVVVDGRRQELPMSPSAPRVLLTAAGELLSQDEISELPSNRPRIVRHDHDGEMFVVEMTKQGTGIAMTIRPAKPKPKVDLGKKRHSRRSMRAPKIETPPGIMMDPRAMQAPRVELAVEPRGHKVPIEMPPLSPPPIPAAAPPPPPAPPTPREVLKTSPPPRTSPSPTQARKIDGILREMIAKGASDLHLSADNCPIFRLHGEMHFLREHGVKTSDDIFGLVREIFTDKAERDFAELRDADFAYEVPGLARFRVNVFEDRKGVGAVLRQIPIDIIPAEKLGLPKACIDLCYLSKGLVVVTGPTGSGKSTTLAAMIDFINKNRSDHIITIEDPVEFVHPNIKCLVNQREVGLHTKTFKNALRAALREDPDIVLVGEMRDLETISIAIETAETGHLVFGTLHTTTAVSTVDRIIDQFPTDRQAQIRVMLSESLKGVVAQVLCKKIGGGRVAAQEVLLGTSAVTALIRDGKTFQLPSVMQTSKAAGMVTMNDALFNLVQQKLVEPKEAYIKAVDKNGLLSMFKNAGLPTTFS